MQSTLNELLLAIERETLGKAGKDVNHKRVMELLASVEKWCQVDDNEVPNDVLKGIDGDVRKMIFSAFATGLKAYTLTSGMANRAHELMEAGDPTGEDPADKWKHPPEEPPASTGSSALDELMKRKPPGRN